MNIYIICRKCDDSYYPGHVSDARIAFTSRDEAVAWCTRENKDDEPGEDYYYVTEVELK
jgi:hypothetical protein